MDNWNANYGCVHVRNMLSFLQDGKIRNAHQNIDTRPNQPQIIKWISLNHLESLLSLPLCFAFV